MRKSYLLALALSGLLAACSTSQPEAQTPSPTTINAFGANPNPIPVNVVAQLSWTVFGQNLICKIDAEDDGIVDYTLQNCSSQIRVAHTYGAPGAYTARLTLTGADGLTQQKTTPVVVLPPNRPPTIPVLSPTTVTSSNDPFDVRFNWTVTDVDSDITTCRFDAESDGVWDYQGLCSGLTAGSQVGTSSSVSFVYLYKYSKKGQYLATLEAADPYAATQATVPVRVPYNQTPVVESLTAERGAGLYVTIDFKVSDPDLDTLGCTLTIQRVGTFRYPNCSEYRRVYQLPQSGEFAVTLEVTDPLEARDTQKITTGVYAEGWMAAGKQTTCSLDTNGKAWCWGFTGWGNIGAGSDTADDNPSPRAVAATPSGSAFTMISMASLRDSEQHTCGVRDNGTLWCWGDNSYGESGSNNAIVSSQQVPVQAHPGPHYTAVATGKNHTCALHNDGTAWCWGSNGYGELGNGTTDNSYAAVRVLGGGRYTSLVAGHDFTCGLRTDGTAWCWGMNVDGQLGSPGGYSSVPRQVSGSNRYTTLSAGKENACGLRADGSAWCWGSFSYGLLGTGPVTSNADQPVAVLGNIDFVNISVGSYHTCGVDKDGAAWCWGWNNQDALGLGNEDGLFYYQPVRVANSANMSGKGFKAIEVGGYWRTHALRDDGSLWSWGNNLSGSLGVGKLSLPYYYVPDPMRVRFP